MPALINSNYLATKAFVFFLRRHIVNMMIKKRKNYENTAKSFIQKY